VCDLASSDPATVILPRVGVREREFTPRGSRGSDEGERRVQRKGWIAPRKVDKVRRTCARDPEIPQIHAQLKAAATTSSGKMEDRRGGEGGVAVSLARSPLLVAIAIRRERSQSRYRSLLARARARFQTLSITICNYYLYEFVRHRRGGSITHRTGARSERLLAEPIKRRKGSLPRTPAASMYRN
jgi:hypothetical protein